MMQSPENIAPDCIRTFDGHGWCVMELKTQTEAFKATKIRFWCQKGDLDIHV